MRVLVTGAAGFLAAAIVERLLARGAEVKLVDVRADPTLLVRRLGEQARALPFLAGDVADPAAVLSAAEGIDVIVHLAGLLTPACAADPIRGAIVNVGGTLAVFEAARALGHAQVIYTSSASVFGRTDGTTPFPETLYGAWKLANEGAARAYAIDHGLASIGFRPYVVYGYGRETGVSAGPSLACRAAALGEAYVIPFTGGAGLVHLDDVAEAYARAVFTARQGASLVSLNGVTATVHDIVAAIRKVVPDARIRAEGPALPVVAHIEPHCTDVAFADFPVTGLEEGIARTIAAYRTSR